MKMLATSVGVVVVVAVGGDVVMLATAADGTPPQQGANLNRGNKVIEHNLFERNLFKKLQPPNLK
jgi:hypothetical protein